MLMCRQECAVWSLKIPSVTVFNLYLGLYIQQLQDELQKNFMLKTWDGRVQVRGDISTAADDRSIPPPEIYPDENTIECPIATPELN